MTKVIVIGCSDNSKLADAIIRERGENDVIFYDKPEDVPIQERGLSITQCHELTSITRFEIPFIPRQPKGHIRCYKYHR